MNIVSATVKNTSDLAFETRISKSGNPYIRFAAKTLQLEVTDADGTTILLDVTPSAYQRDNGDVMASFNARISTANRLSLKEALEFEVNRWSNDDASTAEVPEPEVV